MEVKQKYCVVATMRDKAHNRVMITGPMSEDEAYEECHNSQKNRLKKSMYKYFKVAKYPFKEIK